MGLCAAVCKGWQGPHQRAWRICHDRLPGRLQNRRCLVPANAFNEWSGQKGSKVKWRITLKDEPLFAFAGLWDWWRDPKDPDSARVEAFTIITTVPNDILADIHDRMPVIVAEADYQRWLETGSRALLRPVPSEAIDIAVA